MAENKSEFLFMEWMVWDLNDSLTVDVTATGQDYNREVLDSPTPSGFNNTMDDNRLYTRYTNVAFGFVLIALALLILWTIFGNIMVWCALYRVNHLKTLSNYLIGNLALCDFLLALTVLPMSAGNDLLGWWCFGETMCHVWLSIDVLCCTASIWSLLIISVDRLTATIYPIWYRDQHKKKRAALYIALVWVFSILVSVPPFFGWGDTISMAYSEGNSTHNPQCILFENESYVIYSASGSFVIPLAAMGLIYARIFMEIRERMAVRHEKKMRYCRKHSSATSTGSPEDSEAVDLEGVTTLDESSCYISVPQGSSDVSSNFEYSIVDDTSTANNSSSANLKPALKSPDVTKQSNGVAKPASVDLPNITYTLSKSRTAETEEQDCQPDSNLLRVSSQVGDSSLSINSNDSGNESCQQIKSLKPDRHVSIDENVNIKPLPYKKISNSKLKCPKKRDSSITFPDRIEKVKRNMEEKARRRFDRREERATKIMATIMACFIVCWLPFFIMYIIRAFCKKCYIQGDLLTFIIWLGYANSGLNPILYTIFNEDFRTAFRNLLCPSLRKSTRR